VSLELELPQKIDIIPAADVEALMWRVHADLTELSTRAVAVSMHAAQLEQRLAADGIDADTSSWMLHRLQQHLAELRTQWSVEVSANMVVSRWQADDLLDAAERPLVSFAGALGQPAGRWFDRAVAQPIRWSSVERQAPGIAYGEHPVSMVEPSAPSTVDDSPVIEDELAAPSETTRAEPEFWVSSPSKSWWRRAARPSVLLQAAAGVAVVTAIVVQLT